MSDGDEAYKISADDEAGIELTDTDDIDGKTVPGKDSIMDLAHKIVDLACDKAAEGMAKLDAQYSQTKNKFSSEQEFLDGAAVPDFYTEIFGDDPLGRVSYTDEEAEESGYYADIPPLFKRFTHGSASALQDMRSSLKSAWETLDEQRNNGVMQEISAEIHDWNGSVATALREGFVFPFRQSMYNQQLIIKAIFGRIVAFQELQYECRVKAKEIAEATVSALKQDEEEIEISLGSISSMIGLALAIANPPEGAMIITLTLIQSVAGVISSVSADNESGKEHGSAIPSATYVNLDEVINKMKQRLDDLDDHLAAAEKILNDSIKNDMKDITDLLSGKGRLGVGRNIRPYSPDVSGDFDRGEFLPPGLSG